MKKFILTVVAYVVVSMCVAVPWHMIWFKDLYHQLGAIGRENPIIALGMLAMVIQGMVVAYLYPKLQEDRHPVLEGIRINFLLGMLVYSVMGPATAAKYQIEPVTTFLAYHTTFQAIQFIFTGVAIGLIQGKK